MNAAPLPASVLPPRLLWMSVGALGAAAMITQLTLLRELLGAFSGNELVLGLALGGWLLLTGAGAWLGSLPGEGRPPEKLLAAGLIGVALLPVLQFLALRGARDVLLPRGGTAGLGATILGCGATLLPFCVLSGALLTVACRAAARTGAAAPTGRVYLADTLGSLFGGACFSFVLVARCDHFTLLGAAALVCLAPAAALAAQLRARGLLTAALIAAAAVLAALFWGDVDARSAQWRHREEIVYRASSPYGRLVVTRAAGQLTFFENGVPILHTENQAAVEEAAHYAMAQRPGARHVLLIGGAVAGTAREVLRHGPASVTCLELDPALLAAGRRFLPAHLADPRLTLLATDGRRFLQRTPQRFDVIILDLPDPATLALNRFFTREFFAAARRALAPDGVIAFAVGRYENYLGADLARTLASAHGTLRSEFASVLLIPGGRVFFLGSPAPLTLDIAARLDERAIPTSWVNRHFLAAALAPDRLADLARAVAQPAALNTDFAPVLYHYHLRHWLGQFASPHSLIGLLAAGALAAYVVRLRAAPRVVFAAGFAAATLELVLLLAYQVFYGSLYQQIGLVVTVCMTGLAAGAAWSTQRPSPHPPLRALAALGLALAALAAALPLALPPLGRLDALLGTELAGQTAILLLTFLISALAGAQFPLAGTAEHTEARHGAARLFSADLLGAALGALLTSAWLIPVLGVTAVCLLTAGLNLGAAALAWRQGIKA